MEKHRLKNLIADEGFKLDPYMDTKDLLTGGVGHLMLPEDIDEFDYNWSKDKKTAYWIDHLERDYAAAKSEALAEAGKFKVTPSPEALEVLTELKFNMGGKKFNPKKWPSFYKAMSAGDKEEASRQLLLNGAGDGPSKWLGDVKVGRATRITNRLKDS